VALITGATLTMVSAGVGGYFLVRRGADQDQALKIHGAVVAGVGRNGCASQPSAELCRQLSDRYDAVDRDRKWAIASFATAGVLGAATVTAFFLWPQGDAPRVYVGRLGRGVGIVVGGDFK
jgi:hypothetical protein